MSLDIQSDDYYVFLVEPETGLRIAEICDGDVATKEVRAINLIAAMDLFDNLDPKEKTKAIRKTAARLYPVSSSAGMRLK